MEAQALTGAGHAWLQGFDTRNGERVGYNTDVYSESEVSSRLEVGRALLSGVSLRLPRLQAGIPLLG